MSNLTTETQVAVEQGSSIRQRRKERGYGLEQLSIATGLTIGELIAAENGNGVSRSMNRIHQALR